MSLARTEGRATRIRLRLFPSLAYAALEYSRGIPGSLIPHFVLFRSDEPWPSPSKTFLGRTVLRVERKNAEPPGVDPVPN